MAGGAMDLTFVGVDQVVRRLRNLGRGAPAAAGVSLFIEGNIEMTEMKERTPLDEGILRATGTVHEPVISKTGASVRITFGGPSTPYAIRQHEETSWLHPKGGEAKWVENVLSESKKHMLARMASHLTPALAALVR